MLKQDVDAGIAFIAQNTGMNQQQAAQLFSQLAMKFGGQQPPSQQASAQPDGQAVIDPTSKTEPAEAENKKPQVDISLGLKVG